DSCLAPLIPSLSPTRGERSKTKNENDFLPLSTRGREVAECRSEGSPKFNKSNNNKALKIYLIVDWDFKINIMAKAKVTIVYHSKYGHTKLQAEAVHRGIEKIAAGIEEIEAELITTAEAIENLDKLDSSDAIIFGCPTYMGNISAGMKEFIEVAAKKWFTQSWKDKIAGAFTNSSSFSGDKLNTLNGLMINAMQHGMIYVGTGMLPAASDPNSMNTLNGPGPEVQNRVGSSVGPMAASFQVKPPDAPPKGDIETAELYGKRVAELTLQFVRGRK
ncbi:MAG: flavodoxin family protein, partial [Candidatus Caenarcaniphilales bacterium]|nr:flavodoxin family protein [Candidatus Caenarcaniphilales bacterium]